MLINKNWLKERGVKMTYDLWHTIPGPLMVPIICCVAGFAVWTWQRNKEHNNKQDGTGLKIISTILCILLCYVIFFTDIVNWPANEGSSRKFRDAQIALALEETITVVKEDDVTITILKSDWDDLTIKLNQLLADITVLEKSMSK